MPISLQVLYPVADGTRFDHDYYVDTHVPLVDKHFGPHLTATVLTRPTVSPPDGPPVHHVIATFIFADQAAFDAAMATAQPVIADIANFTDVTPQMQVGETIR